jgi:hypothetical protein
MTIPADILYLTLAVLSVVVFRRSGERLLLVLSTSTTPPPHERIWVSDPHGVDDVTRSHHVPLLLAPYSMTMYRGS